MTAQLCYLKCSSACGRHVSNQLLLLSLLLYYHYGLLHRVMLRQHSFNLSQLNSESPQLDLVITSTQILNLAICTPARQVSRPIQPLSWLLRKWIRDKSLRRQVRSAPISPRQTYSPDVQLSPHSHRHRLHPGIQNVELRIRNRAPDRNSASSLLLFFLLLALLLPCARPGAHINRSFRRPIQVVQLYPCAQTLMEALHYRSRQCLSARDYPPQTPALLHSRSE